DGKRDKLVTGVQTCLFRSTGAHEGVNPIRGQPQERILVAGNAPMTDTAMGRKRPQVDVGIVRAGPLVHLPAGKDEQVGAIRLGRSEERRVGKECRYGWTGV